MFSNVHAAALLALVLAPALAILLAPGLFPRSAREVFLRCLPFGLLGIGFSLSMSASGYPVAEWLIPAVGTLAAGCFVRKDAVFRLLSWGLLLASAALCLNAVGLRATGYTSSPALTIDASKAVEQATVRSISEQLQARYLPGETFPPGPVADLLPGVESTAWERKEVTRLWHTPFSGLYEIRSTPGRFWCPGGEIETGSARLTWQPT